MTCSRYRPRTRRQPIRACGCPTPDPITWFGVAVQCQACGLPIVERVR